MNLPYIDVSKMCIIVWHVGFNTSINMIGVYIKVDWSIMGIFTGIFLILTKTIQMYCLAILMKYFLKENNCQDFRTV